MLSVADAKARFSSLLKRARNGEPQFIGERAPRVLFSLGEYKRLKALDERPHLGKWLVEYLLGCGEIELPPRDDRPSPFADWTEDDWAALDEES